MQIFRTELVGYLSTSLSSVAIKTAWSLKEESSDLSMHYALQQAFAGAELVFLDLRKRAPPQRPLPAAEVVGGLVKPQRLRKLVKTVRKAFDRGGGGQVGPEDGERRLLAGWKDHEDYCEKLLEKKICESFDVCSVAFLHTLLGGGSHHFGPRINSVPLHEAVAHAQKMRMDNSQETGVDVNQQERVLGMAEKLAARIVADTCKNLNSEHEDYDEERRRMTSHVASCVRALLLCPHFHAINIHELLDAKRMMNQLVQADRLPTENSLEGLLLLQHAWRDHDVACHLARRYKIATKFLYMVQLLLASSLLIFTHVDLQVSWMSSADLLFLLALLSSATLSIEGMFRPKPRWRALRAAASSLESIIWSYRARVGEFQVHRKGMAGHPETVLCKRLNEWGSHLLASADLQRTALSKNFPETVFRHQQYAGQIPAPDTEQMDDYDSPAVDDHHSPLHPALYVIFRMEKALSFYKRRIPLYARHEIICKLMILACSVACSILARFESVIIIASVAAFATLVTTWSEFVDAGSKVERYTSAVQSMTSLLNWWKKLSHVEKASLENISKLILESEQIIAHENNAWVSSGTTGATANENGATDAGSPMVTLSALDPKKMDTE
ncbi:unnamed protein product [Durusdinium trenchii]